MEMMPDLSADTVKARIERTLRLFVGHGRQISWADLAEATGDKERKLRSYVESGGSDMPLDVFMRVFTVLPPEALSRVLRPMGFAPKPIDLCPDATVLRALAQASRLVADGNEFLEDGELDRTERDALAERAGALLPVLHSIAGGGSAPH